MSAEEDNALNEAKWELGRHLFFDERLSDDGAVSCASCHIPSHAFAQNLAVPEGSDGVAGTRNAPALMNMAWQPAFHREGGIHSLEAQVLAPIQEPTEFNRDVVELVDALALDPQYQHWSEQALTRGLNNHAILTGQLGRWQRIDLLDRPLVVLDGAHNPDGVTRTVEELETLTKKRGGHLHVVWGAVSDKDASAVMGLLPEDAMYWWCAADIPRAMSPDLVANVRPELSGGIAASPVDALQLAWSRCEADDVIWVGGSLFVVGDVLRDAPGRIPGWPEPV